MPQISKLVQANQVPVSKHQKWKEGVLAQKFASSNSFSGSLGDQEADDVEGSASSDLDLILKA